MTSLTLYQFEECPFCRKVRETLDKLGVEDYEKVNVSRDREDPQRKELMEKTGVYTVPVMKFDEEYVGDSAAIIERLESLYSDNQGDTEKAA